MEYQNNDSEYYQKNDEEVKSEYFINASQDSSCANRNAYRHNIRGIKRQIKAIMLILGCGAIIVTERSGITKKVSSFESEIENQVIYNTEIHDETVNYEILEESIPADVEEEVIVLTAEEKDYILNLKSALDAEDYDGVLKLIYNSQAYKAICDKGVIWKLDEQRHTVMMPNMEVVQGGSGEGFYFTYNKSNKESLYYGDILNGLASGNGIKFERWDSGTQPLYKYHKGAFSNGKANGFGLSVSFTVSDMGVDGKGSLEGNFSDNLADGLMTISVGFNDGIYKAEFDKGRVQLGDTVSEEDNIFWITAIEGDLRIGIDAGSIRDAYVK